MQSYEFRYSRRKSFEADEFSALAYVKCGLPKKWLDICVLNWPKTSSRSLNPLYRKQRYAIVRFARRHGFYIWRTFSSLPRRGKGGRSVRRGLSHLLVELEARKIPTLLVDQSHRLSRRPVALALLLLYLRSKGVKVIETATGNDLTSDPTLEETIAQGSQKTVLKGRRWLGQLKSHVIRLQGNRPLGRKPYGVTDEEKEVLACMIRLCRKLPKDRRTQHGRKILVRRSFQEIADELNAKGWKTRTGKDWSGSNVRSIVARVRPDLLRNWAQWAKRRT